MGKLGGGEQHSSGDVVGLRKKEVVAAALARSKEAKGTWACLCDLGAPGAVSDSGFAVR